MPDHFILHLGLHKTATTALQDFLANQNKALMQAGVRYVPLAQMRSDVTPLLTSLEMPNRVRLGRFLGGISKPTVLLSDENIIGSPGDLMQGTLYPYARNRIETFCEEHTDAAITLFLTLREPHAFLVSMYSEYLRHNSFVTFEHYIDGYDVEAFSYRNIFGWLAELPTHVRIRTIPFETARGGGVQVIAQTIVDAACETEHGVDLSVFPSVKSRSAFSAEEVELATDIAARAGPRAAQLFLKMLDARGQRFGERRFEVLPDLSDQLSARYSKDLELFFGLSTRDIAESW